MKKVENKGKKPFLNVYCDYEVNYSCDYSFINEDGDFVNKTAKSTFTAEGGKLINIIAKLMLDCDCVDFGFYDNGIFISHFDVYSGESEKYYYEVKEV